MSLFVFWPEGVLFIFVFALILSRIFFKTLNASFLSAFLMVLFCSLMIKFFFTPPLIYGTLSGGGMRDLFVFCFLGSGILLAYLLSFFQESKYSLERGVCFLLVQIFAMLAASTHDVFLFFLFNFFVFFISILFLILSLVSRSVMRTLSEYFLAGSVCFLLVLFIFINIGGAQIFSSTFSLQDLLWLGQSRHAFFFFCLSISVLGFFLGTVPFFWWKHALFRKLPLLVWPFFMSWLPFLGIIVAIRMGKVFLGVPTSDGMPFDFEKASFLKVTSIGTLLFAAGLLHWKIKLRFLFTSFWVGQAGVFLLAFFLWSPIALSSVLSYVMFQFLSLIGLVLSFFSFFQKKHTRTSLPFLKWMETHVWETLFLLAFSASFFLFPPFPSFLGYFFLIQELFQKQCFLEVAAMLIFWGSALFAFARFLRQVILENKLSILKKIHIPKSSFWLQTVLLFVLLSGSFFQEIWLKWIAYFFQNKGF